jgi:NAD-dependent deacetylase
MSVREHEQLCALMGDAVKMLIFTGAGISTNSGIPDFRGPGGVWTKRSPVFYQDFMRSGKARIEHWEYKLEAWDDFKNASPNTVHEGIVKLEKGGRIHKVITQNIDGLHQKAGTSRALLVELHGTNAEVECQKCLLRSEPESHFEYFRRTGKPPVCQCGGFLKSATISFGQNLLPEDIQDAENATAQADLVVALGSSLSVYPAASIPFLATRRGVPYIIINRGETEHDDDPAVTLRIEGDVSDIFPPAVDSILS